MKGWRKFAIVVLYVLCVTAVAICVVFRQYDTLLGVGGFATGLATGVGAFMWGNAKEHQAKPPQ